MHPIIAKLDQLSEIKAAAEVTRLDYEAKRAEIMKAVQAQLDDLAAEFEPLIKSAEERAAELEVEIKRDVLTQGASIKGRRLQAVFSRGRVSWDTEALDAYAIAHPEVGKFRRQGQPSVSLRVVK